MESPRQPEDVKPRMRVGEGAAATPAGARAVPRYPKPPVLWRRILLLCIHPESWPMAARYPSRFTLMALGVVIVVAAMVAGIGEGVRFAGAVNSFGAYYEKQGYPALEISREGVLKPVGEWKGPIRFSFESKLVVIDPTGQTSPESLKMPGTVLITDHSYRSCGEDTLEMNAPLSGWTWMLEPGSPETLTGAKIQNLAPAMGILFGILEGCGLVLGNVLWAAAMMFLICPLIMAVAGAGERGLMIPKRAAYRMAAGFLVPLVLFGGLLHATGHSIFYILGADYGLLFWFFASAAMAVWTAMMARRMFVAPVRKAK